MPINTTNAFQTLSHNSAQTRHLGMCLGAHLQPGDVICLQGELGAGKTTFVQGLATGWGSIDAVSSPTFVLVNVYRRSDGAQLFHFDTYRVESAAEAEELDLDSMLNSGALIIEWPERLSSILPPERLGINLDYSVVVPGPVGSTESTDNQNQELLDFDPANDIRTINFQPFGERYIELLNKLRSTIQDTE
jgi:tRNA threonylcarbamoyladenosine biosynthesis protein TsaE